MIVDHRTYTVKPGTVPLYLKAYTEKGKAIQTKHLGEPFGWFWTEVGPLNQIVHIWAYDSMADREQKRKGLHDDPAWQEYVKVVREYLVAQENKIMIAAPFISRK